VVGARPWEYLVHVRGGEVRARSSGQGAWCLRWPGDSVALIPTSIRRLQFTADQVTLERVGVEVTGLAVYRVAEPLIAFRMLDFSDPTAALGALTQILQEMFVGSCRRLVANLPVEAVMTRRKEALATELMREIAPVVQGTGRPQDGTRQGWGVVLDTIEIQNVRILSAQVFDGMQAEFRAELERRSQHAALEADQDVARRRAEVEEARRLEALAGQERALAAEGALMRARHAQALEQAGLQAERDRAAQEARLALEARGRAAEAEAARHALALEAEREAQAVAQAAARAQVENDVSEARIRHTQVQLLPEVARALAAQPVGRLEVTQVGAGQEAWPLALGLARRLTEAMAGGDSAGR
jgi:flotillin